MSEYVGLHDNGKSSVQGFMDIFSGLYGSGVANISNTSAWAVSQRGAGANMSVDIASGRGLLPDTLIHYPAWSDATVNKTITTADPSNPRHDIIVAYMDESVPTTTVTNNLGALKFMVVAGTPAASPSDPSDPTIQTAVGTGNPWIKLARVTVNAAVVSIVDANITDLRTTIAVNGKVNTEAIADQGVTTPKIADDAVTTDKIAPAAVGDTELKARFSEVISDFIYSGGVVAQSAGLVGTFSNIVYYISGVRYTATSVANKTYTASKDTYVDINSSGTPTYTEVANGAASPALTSGYIRVAKVVTNGSAITSVSQYGKENAVQIYPTDKTQGLFYQELARTTLTTTGTTITVSGIAPRKYLRVLVFTPISSGTISHTMYFNNDTGNNYARRRAENGAADITANNNASIMASTAATARWFTTADIINYASEEKMVHGFTSHNGGNGAANYPTRIEFSGKWANTTDAITRIDVANGGAGNFGAGSEVVVLGHD